MSSPFGHRLLGAGLAGVWLVFGLYFKLLNRVPRHRAIVARVLGPRAGWVTRAIGVGEIALAAWVLTDRFRVACALTMTLGLVAMNTLELRFARDLLVSPAAMLALNLLLLTAAWIWAMGT